MDSPALPDPPLPPVGDPVEIRAFATRLRTSAALLEAAGDFAVGPGIGLDRRWSGTAAQAYTTRARSFADMTSVGYVGLSRTAAHIDAYAAHLVAAHADHARLLTRHAEIRSALTDLDTDDPGSRASRVTAAHDLVDRFRRDAQTLTRSLDDADRRLVEHLNNHAGLAVTSGIVGGVTAESRRMWRAALRLLGPEAVPSAIVRAEPHHQARWWASLSVAQQEAVLQEFPEYVGPAAGLPAVVRDLANRALLDRDMIGAQAALATGTGDTARAALTLSRARHVRSALSRTEADSSGTPVSLYTYEPHAFGGDGRVIIGLGNLDTASDVAVHVPGMTTTAASASSNVDKALALHQEAGAHADLASMVWIGYDAPSGFLGGAMQVPSDAQARAGGDALVADLSAFAASRNPVEIHVIGHSYGSTTVGWAGDGGRLAGLVDTVTLLGSPGAGGCDTAAEFGIGENNVYVGSSSQDPVARLGGLEENSRAGKAFGIGISSGLGTDPALTRFGAQRFTAEDQGEGPSGAMFDAHNNYYARGSDSLENLAKIVTGRGTDITGENRRSLFDLFAHTDPASRRR